MKARAGAKAMAGTNGTVIPALSQNDTNTNPHNPMYAIYQYGARGGLLNLIGSESSMSGGNSRQPPTRGLRPGPPPQRPPPPPTHDFATTGHPPHLFRKAPNKTPICSPCK